ncbi:LamG domain-containing protein [Tabrizicola sp. J26]|uniref:LamG domain-containing protein n=1 Tax=Alitabrizicola rongguiensis TaxID=2909234 RepID=UPI001F2A156B|nr:LamG domain-containing protein [Tabrizicola rongguiensis]MCF1707872.1 LamG domain-containing protein [Tabrizicola rongguiensis]
MVKQYFIPATTTIIEMDAAEGAAVKPSSPGTYKAIAGIMAEGDLTVADTAADVIAAVAGPAAYSVAQRRTVSGGEGGKGVGTLAFQMTLNGTAATLDYRVLRAEDGTVLKDWTVAATGLAAGTAVVVCPDVPARLGWLTLQFRSNGSASFHSYANVVGVGRIIALAGQSLAVRFFAKMDGQTTTMSDLAVVPDANGVIFGSYQDSQKADLAAAWAFPSDSGKYDGAAAAVLLKDQVSAHGVTCALVGHARGAQAISAFVPGGTENVPLLAVLDSVGGFEQFIWFQGHSDSSVGTAPLVYRQALNSLFASVAAHNGVLGTSFGKLLCALPNISSTSWGTGDRIASIRQVQADWAAANGASYVQPVDVALVDGVHETQAGGVALARAFSRAMRGHALPTITSAMRTSQTDIVLKVALPPGVAVLNSIGSPAARFKVYARGDTGTPLSLDTTTPITISGATITLKLASAQADGVALDVWFGRGIDPAADGGADMIYDNSADGFGIGRPLAGTVRPVTALPIVSTTSPQTLTMTSATYGTSIAGFGQRATAGYGLTATAGAALPSVATWTIEARFTLSAAPSAVRVLAGMSNKGWIGVNSAGRLLGNFRNASSADSYVGDSTNSVVGTNPAVADGLEHHVALVCTAAQRRLYLDGVLVASEGAAVPVRSAGSSVYGVNAFGVSPATYQWPGTSDEHAIWLTERYIADFTPPTTPYSGNEAGLFQLWHLDGSGASGIV